MTGPPAALAQGPGAIFDVIADFLEKCQFRSAAHAIRAQCSEQDIKPDAEFVQHLRGLADSSALALAEFEAGVADVHQRRNAADQDQDAMLENIIDGLLRKLMAAGHSLSDDTLSSTIDTVLSSDAFSKLAPVDGDIKKQLDACNDALGINDIDVNLYWEQIQKESMLDSRPPEQAPPVDLPAPDVHGSLHGSSTTAPSTADVTGDHAGGGVAAAAAQAAPQAAPPIGAPAEPSAHYRPKRGRGAAEEDAGELDTKDEYHDDEDPGYRIREIYEAELLEELHHKMSLSREVVPDELASCMSTPAPATPGKADPSTSGGGVGVPSSGSGADPASPAVAWAGDELGMTAEKSASGGTPQADTSLTAEALGGSSGTIAPEATDAARPASPTFGGGATIDASVTEDGASTATAAAAVEVSATALSAPHTPPQPEVPPSVVAEKQQVQLQLQQQQQQQHQERERERTKRRRSVKYAASGDSFYPVELDGVVYDSFGLRIVFERDKTGFEESKEFPIRMNTVVAARYQILEFLGSAAFSRAVQCLDLENNKMVCMKIIKNDKDFFDQSLDEIKLLKYINVNGDVDEHCVLRLYDYFYHKEHLIIVTELLRDNLYEFSKFNRECGDDPYFTLGRLQKIANQVLNALEYVHSLRLIHCDLKPENILIRSYSRCEVKVIDFGSSCFVDDHLSSYVQSRSYRAPEVMLGLPYDQKIDLWSLGCILAELWTGYVLFQNESVQSLLARILGIIGDFPYHLMTRGKYVPQYFTQDGQLYQEIEGPACPNRGRKLHLLVPKKTSLRQRMRTDCEEFLDFLTQLLQLDPSKRPTASEALRHPWLARCKYSDGL
mmetsp:Transcript_79743/g.154129  ORF Transcript_79743/g.154129 Transcript_79743/m.154129 type:complete len:838 (+) Transcript_79743:77-2590(+)